jgi:hypothetical protein
MNKINKKGVLNLDWAISLAIFTIFLTIFFMLVFPLFNPRPPQENIIQGIKEKFTDADEDHSVSWTVNRIRLFVSNTSLGPSPVSLLLPYEWNTSKTSFLDNRQFLINENRIFFFHDLSEGPTYIVNSDADYEQATGIYDLRCSSTHSNTTNLVVSYSNGIITQINYLGKIVAQNFIYNVAGTSSFTNYSFVCKYEKGPHNIYPMANSTMIFNYMDAGILNLKLELLDDHYNDYYDGSVKSIPYNGNCTQLLSKDIIDLYDSDEDGIAFVSDNMDITICSSNSTGEKVNLSLVIRNPYKIILHENSYSNITKYTGTRIELGVLQEITGLSYEKLKELNTSRHTRYDDVKSEFEIPPQNDFDWRVSNKTLQ